LHYTKPGAVGRTYLRSNTILNKEEHKEETFDRPNMFSRFTSEQIREKEQIYEEQIEQILEKNKIPEDELTELVNSLKKVLEDYENEQCSTSIEEQESEESIQDTSQVEEEGEQAHKNNDEEEQEAQLSENEEIYQNKHDEGQ
ncbi:unnamed protein product, partial [Rotaria sp. Silwood1]